MNHQIQQGSIQADLLLAVAGALISFFRYSVAEACTRAPDSGAPGCTSRETNACAAPRTPSRTHEGSARPAAESACD